MQNVVLEKRSGLVDTGIVALGYATGRATEAVIFVRVSKKEQDYQRQLEDLRAVAQSQSVQVVAEISEKISGARSNQERDGIQELLRLSRQGSIQKVLVCEVSRLGRSTVEVLQVVDELTQLSVSI